MGVRCSSASLRRRVVWHRARACGSSRAPIYWCDANQAFPFAIDPRPCLVYQPRSRAKRLTNASINMRGAQMAELVDAHGSGPCAARRGGSSPLLGTKRLSSTVRNHPKNTVKTRENRLSARLVRPMASVDTRLHPIGLRVHLRVHSPNYPLRR